MATDTGSPHRLNTLDSLGLDTASIHRLDPQRTVQSSALVMIVRWELYLDLPPLEIRKMVMTWRKKKRKRSVCEICECAVRFN